MAEIRLIAEEMGMEIAALRQDNARLRAELAAVNQHLDAVYAAAGHSASSSEPVAAAVGRLRAVLRRALTVLEERAWEHSAMVAEEIHRVLGDGDEAP